MNENILRCIIQKFGKGFLKRMVINFFIMVLPISILGQTPNWEWATKIGGNYDEVNTCLTVSEQGNIYVGVKSHSSTLILGNDTLNNSGNSDILIVKYNINGNIEWAREFGGLNADLCLDIATDRNDNVFITGYYFSPVLHIGNFELINSSTNGYGKDLFLAKISNEGDVLWAITAGSDDGFDIGQKVATDYSGNVFLTGDFYSSVVTFGEYILSNTNNGYNDLFVAKFNSDGNVIWANRMGNYNDDVSRGICTDLTGNSFITGMFYGHTIQFGTFTLYNSGGSGNNVSEPYIVKFDAYGNVQWAKNGVSSGYDYCRDISTDGLGNSYIIGKGTNISFGGIVVPYGSFIVKYNNNGDVCWAKSFEGQTECSSIAIDIQNNIYVTGFYYDNPIFGGTNSNNQGNTDIFIIKYDINGNEVWAKNTGAAAFDEGVGIGYHTSEALIVSGKYTSVSINFNDTILTNTNNRDKTFIGKLNNINAIDENADKNPNFNIYPNPASTFIVIEVNDGENFKMEIFNSVGEIYKSINIGKKTTVPINGLERGLYFVRLISDEKIIIKPLVIN